MAGLVPAIGRGTLLLRIAGTSQNKPGHDGNGWFHPGRVGRKAGVEFAMTGKREPSAFTRLSCRLMHSADV
jgi:hypothetical protein